jgi:hypothetical protein
LVLLLLLLQKGCMLLIICPLLEHVTQPCTPRPQALCGAVVSNWQQQQRLLLLLLLVRL